MDVKFVNAYVVAVQNVFKTMVGIEVAMGKPSLKTERLTTADITGIMGFAGDKKGTFCLSLPKDSALFIYRAMTGDTVADITSEVIDAIGELTNIISGQTRVEIDKLGYHLSAALPDGDQGSEHHDQLYHKGPDRRPTLYLSHGWRGGGQDLSRFFFRIMPGTALLSK